MTVIKVERIEREEHEFAEHTRQTNQAWCDRWPAHCKSCGINQETGEGPCHACGRDRDDGLAVTYA
jgi:hypothetical protein